MKKMGMFAAALAALVGIAASGAARAADGAWSSQANGPTIYQTNWVYNSSWMSPPGSLPQTATMDRTYYTIKFFNVPAGLQSYLHVPSVGYYSLSGLSGSILPAESPSAKQDMRFTFVVSASTTYVLNPPASGGGHTLIVNYNL